MGLDIGVSNGLPACRDFTSGKLTFYCVFVNKYHFGRSPNCNVRDSCNRVSTIQHGSCTTNYKAKELLYYREYRDTCNNNT